MFNAWRNNASSALQAFIGHQFQDIYQTRNLKWLKIASDDIYHPGIEHQYHQYMLGISISGISGIDMPNIVEKYQKMALG